jgi:hypothetical protein
MFKDLRPDREELVRTVTGQIQFSPPIKQFIAEMAARCVDAQKQPVDALGYAFMYGVVVGALAERESKRKVV